MTLNNNDANHFSALINTLAEVGLTNTEAKVYLTLLNIGTNPASIIASNCGVNRSSCYQTLSKLFNKGFVAQINKGSTSYFTATKPQVVLEQLKYKQDKFSNNIIKLSETFKYFERKHAHNITKKPKVSFFQGTEGVINIMEDTLTAKSIIRAYASLEELIDMIPEYFKNYYERRTAKNIFVKSMYPASIRSYIHKTKDRQEMRETRLLPNEYNICLDLLIYDNKLAITSLKEKFALLVESEDIAAAQCKIFDIIWNNIEDYDSKITAEFENQLKNKIDQFSRFAPENNNLNHNNSA